jgi:lauroyl/myristoyl acyltransferase
MVSRRPDDSLQVWIPPEIEVPRTGDHEADVAAGMQNVVAVVEQHIARYPDQWLLASPVWPMDRDS